MKKTEELINVITEICEHEGIPYTRKVKKIINELVNKGIMPQEIKSE